jgi:hypothetical protein
MADPIKRSQTSTGDDHLPITSLTTKSNGDLVASTSSDLKSYQARILALADLKGFKLTAQVFGLTPQAIKLWRTRKSILSGPAIAPLRQQEEFRPPGPSETTNDSQLNLEAEHRILVCRGILCDESHSRLANPPMAPHTNNRKNKR